MNFTRFILFEEQEGKCHYCQVKMHLGTTGKYFCTVDHKTPKSKGGSNYITNLVGACFTCNNMRGSIPYEAFKRFIQLYGNDRAIREVRRSITHKEYGTNKPMWDVIAGLEEETFTPSIVGRRPYLYDTRKKIRPIVMSYNSDARKYVLYPSRIREKFGNDYREDFGKVGNDANDQLRGGYSNPFFRLGAALGIVDT